MRCSITRSTNHLSDKTINQSQNWIDWSFTVSCDFYQTWEGKFMDTKKLFAYREVFKFLLSMWPHLVTLTPGVTESWRLSSFLLEGRLKVDSNHWLKDQRSKTLQLTTTECQTLPISRKKWRLNRLHWSVDFIGWVLNNLLSIFQYQDHTRQSDYCIDKGHMFLNTGGFSLWHVCIRLHSAEIRKENQMRSVTCIHQGKVPSTFLVAVPSLDEMRA